MNPYLRANPYAMNGFTSSDLLHSGYPGESRLFHTTNICPAFFLFPFPSLRHLLKRERDGYEKKGHEEFKGQIKSRSSENISGREETQWRIIAMKRKYKDYTWERMTESTSKTWSKMKGEMKGEEERILIQRQREEEKKGHEALKGQIKKKNVSFQWDYIRKNGNAMKKKYRDYIWQRMTDSSRKRREQHNDKLWKIESCFQHIHQPFLFSCLMSYEGWSLKRLKKSWVSRQINTWRISVKEEEESSWGDWNRPTQKDSEKERSERESIPCNERSSDSCSFFLSPFFSLNKKKRDQDLDPIKEEDILSMSSNHETCLWIFSWQYLLTSLLLRDSLCFRCLLTFLSLFCSWEEHLHHVCLHRLFFSSSSMKKKRGSTSRKTLSSFEGFCILQSSCSSSSFSVLFFSSSCSSICSPGIHDKKRRSKSKQEACDPQFTFLQGKRREKVSGDEEVQEISVCLSRTRNSGRNSWERETAVFRHFSCI